MCGIAGYFSKLENHDCAGFLRDGIQTLSLRGPDSQKALTLSPRVGFAHARLSILDVSSAGNQPMHATDERFTIIFNGEIFNFMELRDRFLAGEEFHSGSDTEVLLKLYIKLGKDCLQHLNGFFSFAIYDRRKEEIFLARDRYGIKPLLIYSDEHVIVFASELKAILKFPFKREVNFSTLSLYLELNYIPANISMLKGVQKLLPGHYVVIDSEGIINESEYYSIPFRPGLKIAAEGCDYESSKNRLRYLIEKAVERRLVSDVPLGSFLSGGVDSSIVTACAAKHVSQLNTFSLGYKDDPYFDETKYANLVAKKLKTNHTVFSVTTDEMFANIFAVLDYIDEPFADSSSIAVFLLSQKTRQKVTVSLSGDGGDELFAGYNKHAAELRARQTNLVNRILEVGTKAFKLLPQSRHSKWTNLFRQLERYSNGLKLSKPERYWRWSTLTSRKDVVKILKKISLYDLEKAEQIKQSVMGLIQPNGDMNDVLLADFHLVLPGDMLAKVDLMSMANSLEVRVPLLDYEVVNFAFSLPQEFKITPGVTKRILKDAFRGDLPDEIFTRSKHGFEVPLLRWMQTGLRSLIEDNLFNREFIEEQDIFDYQSIDALLKKLFSGNPGDVHATVWSLLVFQYWYKKYIEYNA